ncbi:MAG: type III-B CRISPR-associated protein Cas10/Cmr2 [Fimbriimonadia bacterium]|nr:type III-B CRISPR-associated protein Cas10/Cmr2 [Fimbriimonadia bacterium]
MSKYLLSIAIGPVQDFIAASRRTADLKAGSDLLVDIAKEVAVNLENSGATLIFPADIQTEPANKLLCVVEGDPKAVAGEAQQIAKEYLKAQWTAAYAGLLPVLQKSINEKLADNQIEHFLEFYAAWVPYNGNYEEARKSVERLLAGRKALREFQQPQSKANIPKSPLDPSRDSIVAVSDGFRVNALFYDGPLRLKTRETLDAISLMKRLRGYESTNHVPSTSEMGVRSTERIAQTKAAESLKSLKDIARPLGNAVHWSDLMFESRIKDVLDMFPEAELDVSAIKGHRKQVLDATGVNDEKIAYYAILIADGDRVGKLLSDLESEDQHREFSRKIGEFSQSVPDIVSKYHGYPVYNGGDDVLAFLPVNGAIACVKELSETFAAKMGELNVSATLSAGIAIVHHMDNLQSSLEWARNAEREAKRARDSLAVALHTRGGEAMSVSSKWADLNIWNTWITAFRTNEKGLSRGFPYELRNLAREASNTALNYDEGFLRSESERIIKRKQGGNEILSRYGSQNLFPAAWFSESRKVEEFAKLLVIGRFLGSYPELPVAGGDA